MHELSRWWESEGYAGREDAVFGAPPQVGRAGAGPAASGNSLPEAKTLNHKRNPMILPVIMEV